MNNSYHDDMTGPMEGIDYNYDLINAINGVFDQFPGQIIQVKADYLAERSVQDNIILESAQNSGIVVISYMLMLLYVSLAIGFFPNPIHTKFGLGIAGILVVIGALLTSIGVTFYWN